MLPAETPKLPKWPFLLGDALLLGTAWLIADQVRNPFTGQPLVWIVVCVVAAAILGAIPFLADYARKQDEALDERQRGLDAIARTVAASAEQIGIAANGLNELTQLAQKNLQAASQLGPGLEQKVTALKAELGATRDDDRAALRQEVATLRSVEAQRIEAAVQHLTKTSAEFARAEAALQKQLAEVRELCTAAGDLAVTLNGATEALQSARAAVIAAPTPSPVAPTPEAEAPAPKPEPKRSRKSAPAPESTEPPPSPAPAEPAAVVEPPLAAPAPLAETPEPEHPPAPPETPPQDEPSVVPPVQHEGGPAPEAAPPPRKRAPRKPRAEPAAEPALEIPVVAAAAEPPAVPVAETPDEPRAASADDTVSDEPPKAIEQSRSSDGATRLLVTAYIGIGNRLFIRGDGPGLTWDKGVPLQFVSIGKWRWESSDPTGPVKYKLYKNDAVECTALGQQQVDPGQQQEVAAAF
jgi:hypothetical protein